jgi:hypothetical protein
MFKVLRSLGAALSAARSSLRLPSWKQLLLRAGLLAAALSPLLLVVFPSVTLPDWAKENILILCWAWIGAIGAVCFFAQPKRRAKWRRTRPQADRTARQEDYLERNLPSRQ